MKLDNESLNLLSYCILSKMEELSRINYVSKELKDCIDTELAKLEDIHSKVCEGMRGKDELKDTEHN